MSTFTHPEQLVEVACLECGSCRTVTGLSDDELALCPKCGYVGWAIASDLSYADLSTRRGLGFAFA